MVNRRLAAAGVLLRRSGLVFAPRPCDGDRTPVPDEAIALLETRLLERGVLLAAPLRRALAALPSGALSSHAKWLLGRIDKDLGGDARHIPLFRDFPRNIPADTYELYIRRVFTLLLQEPHQPCVLCGAVGLVEALDPCAHLICRACWDGANYSACPICNRHAASARFFLALPERTAAEPGQTAMPARAGMLGLGADQRAAAGDLARRLLEREIPLTPEELDDLRALSSYLGVADLSWLPAQIPVRVTKATVLGSLLTDPESAPAAADLLARYLDTATDVLRLLYCLMGAPADLTAPPARRRSLPRALRRALMEALAAMPFERLVQDLLRERGKWLNAAEPLHPFEEYRRHPRAALAFACLRGKALDPATDFGRVLTAAAERDAGRVRLGPDAVPVFVSWASEVETGLVRRDLPRVLDLLAQRPGELVRRLAHMAALAEIAWPGNGDDDESGIGNGVGALARTLAETVRRVSPGVLLSALGALRTRTAAAAPRERVYFPSGGAARIHIARERREPLHPATVIALCDVLERELDRRAAALPPADHAVIDAGLFDVVAPFAARTASASLVDLPRGSLQPLPADGVVRLFLHWTQPPGTRVDLDLSVSVHAADWTFIDRCDYTSLRVGDGAVHSGDLTDAPAPDGATEFVDLDPAELARIGARYLVAVVLSYNSVPFDQLLEGFAGYMLRADADGPHFHPRTVEQRFDLHSQSKIALPLLLDLQAGTMRWLDMSAAATGTDHNLMKYEERLAHLAAALDAMFGSGCRVSMFELAARHAAGRARKVTVRSLDGTLHAFRRGGQEGVSEFAGRLMSGKSDAQSPAPQQFEGERGETGETGDSVPGLYLLGRCDLEIPGHSTVYALYPGRLDPASVNTLTAADLVGSLAPDAA